MRTIYAFIIATVMLAAGAAESRAYDFRLRAVDILDSVPVGQTRLLLTTQDSTVVIDKETDIYGDIEVHGVDKGEYILKLIHEDYLPYSALFMLNKDVNLGDIGMTSLATEGTMLAEFTVEGARVVSNAEGHIITPSKELAKYSNNSLDYLHRLALPGLNVNLSSRTISVNGGSPMILVNGVKRSLEYVQAIDPKRIAQIKYSDFPPAKYLLSGVSGVIDIILTEPVEGGTVYAYLSGCPYQENLTTYDNVTYNHKDSEFSLTFTDRWNDNKIYSSSDDQWLDPDGNVVKTEKLAQNISSDSNNLSVTGAYNYQNRHGFVFNAEFTAAFNRIEPTKTGDYQVNGVRNALNFDKGKSHSFTPNLNLYAQKEWTNGRILELNLVGSLSKQNITHLYRNTYDDGVEEAVTNDITGRSPGFVFETQYTQPFGNYTRWNIGIKESFNHGRNIYNGVKDMSNQSQTYLNTNVYGMNGRGFSYSAGGGVGYNHTYLGGMATDQWQPTGSFSLAQKIKRVTLRLNGTYIPTFPKVSQMTDITQDVTTDLIFSGARSLKTSHNWNLSLNAYWMVADHVTATFTVMNDHTNNAILYDYSYLGNGRFLKSPVNFNNINEFDAKGRISFSQMINQFRLSGFADLGWKSYRFSDKGVSRTHNRFDWRISLSGHYRGWSIDIDYTPSKKVFTPYGEEKANPNCDLSLSYLTGPWQFSATIANFAHARGVYSKSKDHYSLLKSDSNTSLKDSGNRVFLTVAYIMSFKRPYQKKQKGLRNMVVDQSVLSPL